MVEANEKEWDNIPHEFKLTAIFTQKGDPKKQKKDKDKDKRPVERSLPRRTPTGSRGCTPVIRKLLASASATNRAAVLL